MSLVEELVIKHSGSVKEVYVAEEACRQQLASRLHADSLRAWTPQPATDKEVSADTKEIAALTKDVTKEALEASTVLVSGPSAPTTLAAPSQ